MKFVVDAHLPRSLALKLAQKGHDAIHTVDLPDQNATRDGIINQISMKDERVVITKDTDFYHSHLLQGRPWKLLLVRTGNTSARDLCDLIMKNLEEILAALTTSSLVEIDRNQIYPR